MKVSRGCCGGRRTAGKSSFLRFCEETELNGLLHVPQTGSRFVRGIYILSFVVGSVAVLFLFANILVKYWARPRGINQEFVTNESMPFPQLNLCRYLVGLSTSQLKLHNVSNDLAKALHWRLEVNYSPGFMPTEEVRRFLDSSKEEYLALKRKLNISSFHELIRHFLPRYDVIHNMTAVIYQKTINSYSENVVPENWLITYVEDLYLYNSICHCIEMPSDSVLALVIPFPPREEYLLDYSKNFQLLPIIRSYLLMDENHDPIARIEPGKKYWGHYKLKSSYLMNSDDHPCNSATDYQQQRCLQDCFGSSIEASPVCSACQSVFMHVNFTKGSLDADICDPWEWVACNSSENRDSQGKAVVQCMSKCIQDCNDMSFEYTVTSVEGDAALSKNIGFKADFMEISENRSIFILSASRRPNKHVRIRQYEIIDLASVFGDVGGYMGLFLGSSVLTIVHIVVFWSRKCLVDPAQKVVRKNRRRGEEVGEAMSEAQRRYATPAPETETLNSATRTPLSPPPRPPQRKPET